MKSLVEELRAESRQLVEMANNSSETQLKKELSERALRLSERAEAIANSTEDPEIIEMNIRRYQRMLAGGLTDEPHRKAVDEMLADAQALLANLRRETLTPNVARRDRCPHMNAASSVRTINR
jgi:hypothetical protein